MMGLCPSNSNANAVGVTPNIQDVDTLVVVSKTLNIRGRLVDLRHLDVFGVIVAKAYSSSFSVRSLLDDSYAQPQ